MTPAHKTALLCLLVAGCALEFSADELQLDEFDRTPAGVTVDSAPQTTTCQMTIIPQGVRTVQFAICSFVSPGGRKAGCLASSHIANVWSCDVTIPEDTEANTWTIEYVFAQDDAGGKFFITGAELVADTGAGGAGGYGVLAGDPTRVDLAVTSPAEDVDPPVITGFSALPATVAPGGTVTCTILANDASPWKDSGCTFLPNDSSASVSCISHGGLVCPIDISPTADGGVTYTEVNHFVRDTALNVTIGNLSRSFSTSGGGGAGGAGGAGSGGAGGQGGAAEANLLVHYEFDTDCTADSSGNGGTARTATCTNGAAWTDADGNPSAGSVTLDGVDDYVLVGGAESLYDFDTENFTTAAWVKVPDVQTGDYNALWSKSDPGANGAGFSAGRDNNDVGTADIVASSVVDVGGIHSPEGPSGIWDNTWHHVAQVREGTSWKTYVDGVAGTADTVAATLFVDDNEFRIGAYTTYAFGYTEGFFDDFRVYDRALDDAEIAALAGVTTGFLVVDVTGGLNPSCVGSVDWSISAGGPPLYTGTGDWGPTLVVDDTYTITWGDSIYDCAPPTTDQKTVNGDTQTFDLDTLDYSLRNATRQISVQIRQNGVNCTPPGCDSFGPWDVTATGFAGEGTLASGTGNYAGETICSSGCDHTASILDGRNYTATFGAETGWTAPPAGNATASATPQSIEGDYSTPGVELWASTEQTDPLPSSFTAVCCEYGGTGPDCSGCSDAGGANVTRVTLASEGLPAHGGDTYAIRQFADYDTHNFVRSEIGAWTGGNPALLAHMQTGALTYFVMDMYFSGPISMGGNFLSIWDFHNSDGGAPIGDHTCPGIMVMPGSPARLRSRYGCDNDVDTDGTLPGIPEGQWFELEIAYRYHSTQGGTAVWINGTQILSSFTHNTRPNGSGDTPQFYSKNYGAEEGGPITPAPTIIYRKNYRASASPFH